MILRIILLQILLSGIYVCAAQELDSKSALFFKNVRVGENQFILEISTFYKMNEKYQSNFYNKFLDSIPVEEKISLIRNLKLGVPEIKFDSTCFINAKLISENSLQKQWITNWNIRFNDFYPIDETVLQSIPHDSKVERFINYLWDLLPDNEKYYYSYSLPIFSDSNEYCIITFIRYKSSLNSVGVTRMYKKHDGNWKMIKEQVFINS